MSSDWLVDKITELVEPVVASMQLELVEVQFRRESTGQVLRLIIDSEEGVGVEQCAAVSREVGYLLEVEDIIDQAYYLEVSSPGLDRPLKTERDFRRCKGKKIELLIKEDGTLAEKTGVVEDCENGIVSLQIEGGLLHYPMEKIAKAVQVIEF